MNSLQSPSQHCIAPELSLYSHKIFTKLFSLIKSIKLSLFLVFFSPTKLPALSYHPLTDKLRENPTCLVRFWATMNHQNNFSASWHRSYKSLELYWRDEHSFTKKYLLIYCIGVLMIVVESIVEYIGPESLTGFTNDEKIYIIFILINHSVPPHSLEMEHWFS